MKRQSAKVIILVTLIIISIFLIFYPILHIAIARNTNDNPVTRKTKIIAVTCGVRG